MNTSIITQIWMTTHVLNRTTELPYRPFHTYPLIRPIAHRSTEDRITAGGRGRGLIIQSQGLTPNGDYTMKDKATSLGLDTDKHINRRVELHLSSSKNTTELRSTGSIHALRTGFVILLA
jgi:hypothetical protein